MLVATVSEEEVREAVFSIGGTKAPGPHGLHAVFYQKHQDKVKQVVCSFIKDIFFGKMSCACLNKTHLCLIHKVPCSEYMSQFRPIGLCNVFFKIITKMVVHRLKRVMPELVKPTQISFVPRRQIFNNIIIAQEVVHSMKNKKGQKGYMAIKLDLTKAYDKLRQSFIHETLLDITSQTS